MAIEFITNPQIEQYIKNLYVPFDPVLDEMHKIAKERKFPIVGPLVGRMLYVITKIAKPERILELGSGFGYSAYWFARANPEVEITLTDFSAENIALAQEFMRKIGALDRCEFQIGDALELIGQTEGEYDIIFNDIDKAQYPNVFHAALPRLKKGGLLICDNVLWSGEVLEDKGDPETEGIKEYTRLIFTSKELFSTIVPIRDGVAISLKLQVQAINLMS